MRRKKDNTHSYLDFFSFSALDSTEVMTTLETHGSDKTLDSGLNEDAYVYVRSQRNSMK
jgi:hypothetical protein